MGNLESFCNNREYINIVSDILEDNKFVTIKKFKHHGITRFEHSLRVSYYSYLIAKALGFNYTDTARGGLLHDFFGNDQFSDKKKKFRFALHPYCSLENASNNFDLSDLEKDIIINHMFPTLPHKIPKYIESWLVCLVDKGVAVYELFGSYSRTFIYRFSNIYLAMLLLLK